MFFNYLNFFKIVILFTVSLSLIHINKIVQLSINIAAIFTQKTNTFTMYILIYVDDIIIICSILRVIVDLLQSLNCEFANKKSGKLKISFSALRLFPIVLMPFSLNTNT